MKWLIHKKNVFLHASCDHLNMFYFTNWSLYTKLCLLRMTPNYKKEKHPNTQMISEGYYPLTITVSQLKNDCTYHKYVLAKLLKKGEKLKSAASWTMEQISRSVIDDAEKGTLMCKLVQAQLDEFLHCSYRDKLGGQQKKLVSLGLRFL